MVAVVVVETITVKVIDEKVVLCCDAQPKMMEDEGC